MVIAAVLADRGDGLWQGVYGLFNGALKGPFNGKYCAPLGSMTGSHFRQRLGQFVTLFGCHARSFQDWLAVASSRYHHGPKVA